MQVTINRQGHQNSFLSMMICLLGISPMHTFSTSIFISLFRFCFCSFFPLYALLAFCSLSKISMAERWACNVMPFVNPKHAAFLLNCVSWLGFYSLMFYQTRSLNSLTWSIYMLVYILCDHEYSIDIIPKRLFLYQSKISVLWSSY